VEEINKLGDRKLKYVEGLWEIPPPFEVTFAVTQECNLKCKHCLARNNDTRQDLTIEKIRSIFRELVEAKIFNLSIFGGEPFVRKDIKEILSFAYSLPFQISVNTNGTLIPDFKEFLKKYPRLSYCVSLDGSREEIVDSIRGSGTFRRILKGLKSLTDFTNKIQISVTIMNQNLEDISNILTLCKSLGIKDIRLNHIFYIGNASCNIDKISIISTEFKKLIGDIFALYQEYGNTISGALVYMAKQYFSKDLKPIGEKILVHPCGAATRRVAIKPDGTIIPCEILWNVECGNLNKYSFKEIWINSDKLNEFRRPLTVDLSKLQCSKCKYAEICYLGHRCNPYYYPEGVNNPSLFCIDGRY